MAHEMTIERPRSGGMYNRQGWQATCSCGWTGTKFGVNGGEALASHEWEEHASGGVWLVTMQAFGHTKFKMVKAASRGEAIAEATKAANFQISATPRGYVEPGKVLEPSDVRMIDDA